MADEVPLDYTSTALTLALEKQGRAPVVLLNRLAGREGRLVANLFGSRELMARGIDATPDTFLDGAGRRARPSHPGRSPVRATASAPVHEVVWQGADVDLQRLPIPRHFEQDAGPYITAGMIAAARSGHGGRQPGVCPPAGHRGRGASAPACTRASTPGTTCAGPKSAARILPVAIVIGAHPAVMLAGAAKMGIGEDEYDLAGALLGQPLQLVRGCTVDVMVPAAAEIVIEGKLLANVHETEGPFGEYTGYVTGRSTHNVVEVSAITMRHDAIFVDVIPGNSAEHLILGRAAKEAWVYKRMAEALPFFVDFHYPSSGTHFHCFVRIDKSAEGQAQQAAQLIVGLDHYIKLVVVVDSDVDPSDEAAVMWAHGHPHAGRSRPDDPGALHVQQARPVERRRRRREAVDRCHTQARL